MAGKGDGPAIGVDLGTTSNLYRSVFAMPTGGFLSIKLDESNYPLWREQIVLVLKSKNLLGYVDGSLPCPQAFLMDSEGKPTNVENPDHLFWHQQDQLILSWINKSLTPQVLSTVTRFQSSHESWAFLERRYADIQQLLGELHNTMRDELPIADYVDKLNGIADKLALTGHLVEDSLLVTVLMNNVGPTFEATIASAQAWDTPIGLDDLIALLLSAEQCQKGGSTPEPTTLYSPKKSSGQSRRKSRCKSAKGSSSRCKSAKGSSRRRGSSTRGSSDASTPTKGSSRRRGSSTRGSSDASTPKSSNSSSNGWWQSSGRPRGFGIDNLMALLLSTEQRQKGSIPGATAIENKSSSQSEGKSTFNSANGSSRGHGSSTRGSSNRKPPKSLNSYSIGRQSSGQSEGKSRLNSANGSSMRRGSSTRGSSNASNRGGPPKSSNSSSNSQPRCQICDRLGHTAINCYNKKNMVYEGRGSSTRGSSNLSNQGSPKSSNSSSSGGPQCQICDCLGHKAINCHDRMNMAYEGRVPTQKLSALAASSSSNNGGTNGDTGTSNHVIADLAK